MTARPTPEPYEIETALRALEDFVPTILNGTLSSDKRALYEDVMTVVRYCRQLEAASEVSG